MNSWLRFKDIIKEATNKMIEHVGRKPLKLNSFCESVKVFIAGTKVKN